jgi:hypothetical protein
MESPQEGKDDQEQFELHKSVFDNDLKKLSQIIKFKKDVIDKKVRKVSEKLISFWPS